jgi:pyruvate/2-oxoglutarate dehydrogenase complex dihydrolipoamide dehydrogenase (E3) component
VKYTEKNLATVEEFDLVLIAVGR